MEKKQDIKYYPIHKLPRIILKQDHNTAKVPKKKLKINVKVCEK